MFLDCPETSNVFWSRYQSHNQYCPHVPPSRIYPLNFDKTSLHLKSWCQYTENFQKAIAARNAPALQKFAPRTPRPVVAPVQKTVFGMRQPPPSIVNLDLPPLPPMLCLPRLN